MDRVKSNAVSNIISTLKRNGNKFDAKRTYEKISTALLQPDEQKSQFEVRRLDEATFASMQHQWNTLLEQSENNNFFLRWEWLHNWWLCFGNYRKLYLFGIYKNDELVGIAPFYIEKSYAFGFLPMRAITFLGTEKVSSEKLSIICKRNEESQVIYSLYAHLRTQKSEWDILMLSDLEESSPALKYLLDEALINDFVLWKGRIEQICPYLILPDNYEALIKKMKRKRRYNLQRELSKLQEQGFELRVVTDSANSSIALEKMIELHNKRWQFANQKGNFVDSRVLRFHRSIVPLLARLNSISFFLLARQDNVIAILYTFQYGNKLLYYQGGFDPEFSKYSPGKTLLALVIKHAIETSQVEFDFLRGDEEYKWHWTSDYYKTITYYIGVLRIRIMLYLAGNIALRLFKDRVKKFMSMCRLK